jgi:hypothetical protein
MRYTVAAMQEATPVMPAAKTTGPDPSRDSGRERATATTVAALRTPMKVMAKTRIGANASPTVSAVRITASAERRSRDDRPPVAAGREDRHSGAPHRKAPPSRTGLDLGELGEHCRTPVATTRG